MAKSMGPKLVAPLAEKFGVPAGMVESLMESGLSVEGVTQALLVNQASDAGLGEITSMLGDHGNDVSAVADALGVSPSAYGEEAVKSALGDVVGDASGAAGETIRVLEL